MILALSFDIGSSYFLAFRIRRGVKGGADYRILGPVMPFYSPMCFQLNFIRSDLSSLLCLAEKGDSLWLEQSGRERSVSDWFIYRWPWSRPPRQNALTSIGWMSAPWTRWATRESTRRRERRSPKNIS